MSRTTVLIVDDNLIIRRGLKSLLANEPDLTVVGEASTGSEAIHWMAKTSADVVLMDIRMPGMDGIKATAEIMRLRPRANILVITALDNPNTLAQTLMAGAKGCLEYSRFSPEELLKAVRTVASGSRMEISPAVALALLNITRNGPLEQKYAQRWTSEIGITSREMDILDLMVTKKSNAEIAVVLGITEKTVKNHINSIYAKLKIKNRYEIINLKAKHSP
ncbi:MAG: response regulator transcription factor [Dehalococcoidia bacterium]|nr:response regulator transcription factor [Dehalococcoidia bacterium]